MPQSAYRNILLLNFAMLCLCTSGTLGKYITLSPPLTIWYRAFFAFCFLGIYCYWKGYSFWFDIKKYGGIILLSGAFMTANFVCFFYALQWSNVTIAMLSLFTFPIMTAFLEPIFLKVPFQKIHLLMGGMVLLGIYFLAPTLDMKDSITQGLLIGLVSALAWSIRNLILKSHIAAFNSSLLMFYQLGITMFLLLPMLFIFREEQVLPQLPYLLFLGLVTTAIGHTLFINSFHHFSVSTASIMASTQPIYGIIVAMILLGEIPSNRSIIGGILILSTVIMESRRTLR